MSTIVLVHGIAQQNTSSEMLQREWLESIATGLRRAGRQELAEQIWNGAPSRNTIDARMAFYGDLFRDEGVMGEPLRQLLETDALALQLAKEWLRRASQRSPDERDRKTARIELAFLESNQGIEQGARSTARSIVRSLSKLRWFAQYGMAVAERFVVTALQQVTTYFTDEKLRTAAVARVRECISDKTRVVLAHSLGTVVAYEALCSSEARIALLVTMGSPLGLRTIVYDRLVPSPPVYPRGVSRWVNVACPDDLVAVEPNLSAMFANNASRDMIIESLELTDNRSAPHDATSYLSHIRMAHLLAEALEWKMPG